MKACWSLLLLILPLASGVQAEVTERADNGRVNDGIYRTLDADGNTVFTDSPVDKDRAEEVRVGPTNTMESQSQQTITQELGDQRQTADSINDDYYQSLAITAPGPQSHVRMPQDNPVPVQVSLTPALKGEHQLVLMDNGSMLEENALDLPNPGKHTLIAQVQDASGAVLIESPPVVVYVQRSTTDTSGSGDGSALPAHGKPAERGGSATTGSRSDRGKGASRGGGATIGGGAQRTISPPRH